MISKFKYNDYLFETGEGLTVNDFRYEGNPINEDNFFVLPNNNGAVNITNYQRNKPITAQITVKASTKEQLTEKIREIKRALSEPNKSLEVYIPLTDGEQHLVGQASMISGENLVDRGGTWISIAKLTINFNLYAGYFEDILDTIISRPPVQGIDNFQPEYKGTVRTAPKFEFGFQTAGNARELRFISGDKTITVKKIFQDDDLIMVDSKNSNVLIRNTSAGGDYEPIDYNGFFPEFNGGPVVVESLDDNGVVSTGEITGNFSFKNFYN